MDDGSIKRGCREGVNIMREQQDRDDKVVDVVCGMTIDRAQAAGTTVLDEITWFFCSLPCKGRFDADPGRFVHGEKRVQRPGSPSRSCCGGQREPAPSLESRDSHGSCRRGSSQEIS